MPVVPVLALAVSAYAVYEQKKGSDAAARTSQEVGQYNAKIDRAEAQQVDLDAQENIRNLRKDAAVYMSRQASSYVAAGVRADTGSPLAVRAATAGQFERRAQQAWADSNAKEARLESAAQAGITEGNAKADMYHKEGIAAVMGGAGKLANMAYGDYKAGDFSFASTGSNDLSSSLTVGVNG